ncbi:MAG: hemerythrin domain-containing protein [Micromonosporaceae bacterium]
MDVLTRDHREIETLLRNLMANHSASLAGVLVASLVRHAIAEEEYVYPAVRDQVPGGERIADRGLAQHAQVEETMQQIADTDTDDPDFDRLLVALEGEVRRHVHHDEDELFPKLRGACTRADLAWLGERVAGTSTPYLERGSGNGSAGIIEEVRLALGARQGAADT